MSKQLSIQEVLQRIKESGSETFTLRFVRSTGKKKGSIKTVIAIYGKSIRETSSKMRNVIKMKDAGTIPITDTESDIYLTPLISHIIGFNQFKVIH